MNESIKRSPQSKRHFYSQPEIAQTYNEQRFGGASGAWVNARETNLALSLLPAHGQLLDLGCGTGRLTRALEGRGVVIGLDSSPAMLQVTQTVTPAALVQGDAFALPFACNSFDGLVALRLVFHFADLEVLLREMVRIVKPGGRLILDTYLWSPRALLSLDRRRWGSGIYIHTITQVEAVCAGLGLQVSRRETCFLFSPYVYRKLPLPVVYGLERVERSMPAQWRARAFWQLTKAPALRS